MEGTRNRIPVSGRDWERGWREAVSRSSESLRREGFTVSGGVRRAQRRGTERSEFVAANGRRVVRVVVILDSEVDSKETRVRLRTAYRRGETRVFVRWPFRWRMLSNVSRWGLRGVSVSTW